MLPERTDCLTFCWDSYSSKNPHHETMMANRIFVGFSAMFCLFPCDLLVELNEQAETPFGDTVQEGVIG